MQDHFWRNRAGKGWSIRVKSDSCAKCGTTPDDHPYMAPFVIEYDAEYRWLIQTQRLGPEEMGASEVVAENVRPAFGEYLAATLNGVMSVADGLIRSS